MFEELSSKLDTVLRRLRGQGKITEANVAETLREVRRVLLDADVNYKVARQFIDDVLKRATGQDVLQSITPAQQIVKIIYDELVSLLGTTDASLATAPLPPTVIMVAGLQGSGKTTFCAKLALYLTGQGRHPLLAAADVHRHGHPVHILEGSRRDTRVAVFKRGVAQPMPKGKQRLLAAKHIPAPCRRLVPDSLNHLILWNEFALWNRGWHFAHYMRIALRQVEAD